MSTTINNPAPNERTVIERTAVESDSSGWAVAVIILLVVIGVGAYYFWSHRVEPAPAAQQQAPVIQVNVPASNNSQPATSQ